MLELGIRPRVSKVSLTFLSCQFSSFLLSSISPFPPFSPSISLLNISDASKSFFLLILIGVLRSPCRDCYPVSHLPSLRPLLSFAILCSLISWPHRGFHSSRGKRKGLGTKCGQARALRVKHNKKGGWEIRSSSKSCESFLKSRSSTEQPEFFLAITIFRCKYTTRVD